MTERINTETGEIISDDFATVLLNMSDGESHKELSDRLRELVQAVRSTGKKGTLTYVIEVAPAGKNLAQSTVILGDKITSKIPEFARQSSMFFADDTGALMRDNPNQLSLWDRFDNNDKKERP